MSGLFLWARRVPRLIFLRPLLWVLAMSRPFKESLHSSSAWELRRGLLGGARMLLRGSYCLLHWFEEEALIVT